MGNNNHADITTSPELPAKYLVQHTHLTCPATNWKYIEGASRSDAHLVMLDLEDSIPRDDDALLEKGRQNIGRAFRELDWGNKIRYFRPRGLELDPGFTDMTAVIENADAPFDGLVFPKVENADEVRRIEAKLIALEKSAGIPQGQLTFQVLIESVGAEQNAFEIAAAGTRLTGIIFGAFDYWSSLGLPADLYHADHPLIRDVRCRIVKAACAAKLPAIAEMTLNYPTKNKSQKEQQAALDQCLEDAKLAQYYGFSGKWTGIPAQVKIVNEVFALPGTVIEKALREVGLFMEAEANGQGATMIDGKMADRATDRLNRTVLKKAYALGKIDEAEAKRLKLI